MSTSRLSVAIGDRLDSQLIADADQVGPGRFIPRHAIDELQLIVRSQAIGGRVHGPVALHVLALRKRRIGRVR